MMAAGGRNILIVSIDSLRYDCCSLHPETGWLEQAGLQERLQTPTLERVGRRSLYFTKAFSTSTYTTAAHASLFTGLYPPRHGVRSFFKHKLAPDVSTLAQVLHTGSYETFFMSDNGSLFELTGLTKGFSKSARDEDDLIDKLKRHRQGPVMAFAHFFDVHDPYLFSPRYGEGEENRDYFSRLERECKQHSIAFTTENHNRAYYELFYKLGGAREHFFPWYVSGVNKFDSGRFARFCSRLDAELRAFDEWIVVVLSDHGEGRVDEREAQKFRHEGLLYDEVVRIPLMLSYPDCPWAACDDLVSIVDLFPTLLRLAGVEQRTGGGGQEFDGIVIPEQKRRFVCAETWQRHQGSLFSSFDNESFLRQRAVRFHSDKYVINGRPETFVGDPFSEHSEEIIAQDLFGEFVGGSGTDAKGGASLCSNGAWRGERLLQVFCTDADPFEVRSLSLSELDAEHTLKLLRAVGCVANLEGMAVMPREIGLFGDLRKRIAEILGRVNGAPLGIYGAGEHTRMLFEKTALREGNITALVDSDEGKWGTLVAGIEVANPASLVEASLAGVIVSSHAFQDEIHEILTRQLSLPAEQIFRLYGEAETAVKDYTAEEEDAVAEQLKNLGYL